MPVFVLYLKARLENIAKISIPDDFTFSFTLKCSDSEDTRDISFTAEEEIQLNNSRGVAHFVIKWDKGSKHESTITVMQVKNLTRPIESDDSEKFVPIIGFECRGLEPIEFHPTAGFRVETQSGKVYEEIDLSELDWCDFDEQANDSVGIYELESKIEVHRGR